MSYSIDFPTLAAPTVLHSTQPDYCMMLRSPILHAPIQVNPGYVDHKTLDSVELLIMWDGQYETPAQNALAAVPYMEISWRQYITRAATIKHKFVPVIDVFLMVLLKSSFLSMADVQAFSEAVMQMWRYFQIYDWERTWSSPQVSTCQ